MTTHDKIQVQRQLSRCFSSGRYRAHLWQTGDLPPSGKSGAEATAETTVDSALTASCEAGSTNGEHPPTARNPIHAPSNHEPFFNVLTRITINLPLCIRTDLLHIIASKATPFHVSLHNASPTRQRTMRDSNFNLRHMRIDLTCNLLHNISSSGTNRG